MRMNPGDGFSQRRSQENVNVSIGGRVARAAVHPPSHPFNPWLFLALPLSLAALLLAFESVTLDLALADLIHDPDTSFIGRHS